MPCGVKTCGSSDDRFLWKCEFCHKTYHAACVGVQRTRELFISAFMLPVCADCQEILRKEADVRKLLHQQEQLVEAIRGQTDTNQRIAADLKKIHLITDLFDSIEQLLNDVKESLTTVNKNSTNMCSVISTHMKSCDSQMHTTINNIMEANTNTSQQIKKIIDDRLSTLSNAISMNFEERQPLENHSPQHESTLQEILGEVKIVSEAVSDLQKTTSDAAITQSKTLAEELSSTNYTTQETQTDEKVEFHNWRIIGDKKIWKRDWTEFDARQRARRLQEKEQNKARRRRKQKQNRQKKYNNNNNNNNRYGNNSNNNRTGVVVTNNNNHNNHNNNTNNNRNNNFHNNNNIHNNHNGNTNSANITNNPIDNNNNNINMTVMHNHQRINALDKELLASAKAQFSGPPLSTDHPIPGLSAPKFINFQKGETINPYRVEKNVTTQPENAPPLLDPMRPPVVRLTEQSATGDKRYLKARLRDHKIMETVRTYLAFLHDQPTTVCCRGITKISASVMLAAEGLPTDTNTLREIFLDVHEELGISRNDALADLQSHRTSLSSERTHRLQQLRESSDRFHNSSFRK